ncbi:MAG TPA: glycosyltransferase family 4 protein [Candidatus Limnocylindria bacterium]|nr:glycosyltransferase family 4 protein [Candidatus Limnocylindria bacterium]
MDVALVVHDFDRNNGQGRYCIELTRRLRDRCRFTLYSNTADPDLLDGIVWERIPAWRQRHLTAVFTFLLAVESRLRGREHDLIHAQGLSSWRADVATVHMVNAARAHRLAPARRRDRLFSQIVTPFERAFYRRPQLRHAIVMARGLGRELHEEYGWTKPLSVIPHGTDTEQFRPPADAGERQGLRDRFGVPRDRWVWLFMGEAVKGLGQVIDRLPGFPSAHLLVVTRSPMALFQEQARRVGVAERITFHGFEARPELAYRAADVFVYPSAYDPFGMVATEAMASGLATVIGGDTGAAELVTEGIDGLLCDPARPATLQAKLARLSADPDAAARLGQAARATILRHSWEACGEATLGVYRTVMETPRLS